MKVAKEGLKKFLNKENQKRGIILENVSIYISSMIAFREKDFNKKQGLVRL